MKYFEEPDDRACLQCGASIEGRADKQFCDSSCKARYNRENAQKASNPILKRVYLKLPEQEEPVSIQRLPLAQKHGQDEDVFKQAELGRQAEHLHKAYTKHVIALLKEDGYEVDSEWLDEFIGGLDDTSTEYRQHPSLQDPSHPAHSRLADLYLMRDYLRELRERIENADEEVSFFGRAESDTVCIEISKKRRKRLRENMLGVA